MAGNWISKRDMAAIAGGLAVGVIGSRLLAPMMATASGSMRARFGQDPFKQLIEDHRYILSLLNEMEQTHADATTLRAKLFLALKRTLAKHALAEEDIVYPMLHGDVHAVEESRHLYDEHAEIKIHLFELERLLKEKIDWRQRVRELRNLIEAHARQEEEIEFPKLRQILSRRGNTTLSGQIRREESLLL
jgi:iron-sulfur cluster repair protein YtfE (RIC family)